MVDGLRSAQDAAQNGSDAIVAKNVPYAIVTVALVSIRVLPITLIVAAHKALTKSRSGGILVVARTLRVVALPTLAITGARVQASLVTLVQLNLIPVIVPTVAIATVIAIATVVRPRSPITFASPFPAPRFVIIAIPILFPLLVLLVFTIAIPMLVLTLIISILRVSGKAAGCGYAKNKSDR